MYSRLYSWGLPNCRLDLNFNRCVHSIEKLRIAQFDTVECTVRNTRLRGVYSTGKNCTIYKKNIYISGSVDKILTGVLSVQCTDNSAQLKV